MANTRDIRRRIKSIRNTAQITKAMQMVAASKMRRAQEAALSGRPYSQLLNQMLEAASEGEAFQHPLHTLREGNRTALLVITTDKGLCGALNSNLLRLVANYPKETQFVTVGRKGRQFLARTKRNLVADFEVSEACRFLEAKKIGSFLMKLFLEEKVDRVEVAYTNFISTLTQTPGVEPLLPLAVDFKATAAGLTVSDKSEQENQTKEKRLESLFEPSSRAVLESLFPHAVNFEIWHYLLEARASEHSARMVAMKNATDNAKQLIKDLTLEYNKIRQAAITTELLEISAAAAAMN
jgi:F-type H+-transporting ATPase subunit gamma